MWIWIHIDHEEGSITLEIEVPGWFCRLFPRPELAPLALLTFWAAVGLTVYAAAPSWVQVRLFGGAELVVLGWILYFFAGWLVHRSSRKR